MNISVKTAVISVLGAAALGYLAHQPDDVVIEKEVVKTVTVEKEVVKYKDKVIYRDNYKETTTTKPDGTVIKVVDKSKVSTETSEKKVTDEKTEGTETVAERESRTSSRSHYRAGVVVPGSALSGDSSEYLNSSVLLGVRVFGLPLFVEGYYKPVDTEFGVGVSVEW